MGFLLPAVHSKQQVTKPPCYNGMLEEFLLGSVHWRLTADVSCHRGARGGFLHGKWVTPLLLGKSEWSWKLCKKCRDYKGVGVLMFSLISLFFLYLCFPLFQHHPCLPVCFPFQHRCYRLVCVFFIRGLLLLFNPKRSGSNQSKLLHSRKVGPQGYVTFTQHAFTEACCWEFLPENKVARDRSLRNLLLTAA